MELLKKKPIERSPVNEPAVTTSKKDISNMAFDHKKEAESNQEKEADTKRETNPKKETTYKVRKRRHTIDEPSTNIRIGMSIKDKIDTLLVMNKFDIVNDLIDYLVDDYLANELTKDERKTFDTILDIYKTKRQ